MNFCRKIKFYKKNIFFSVLKLTIFLLFSQNIFAQNSTLQNAKNTENSRAGNFSISAIKESLEKSSSKEAVEILQKKSLEASSNLDKRILFSFTASIQEQMSLYKDASDSYAKAVSIPLTSEDINSFILQKDASQAEKIAFNTLKKTSSVLVLDAVRCSLNAGESATALNYLNSSIRNSKDEKISAKVKFYEIIAKLCDAQSDTDLDEIIVMLKAYSTLQSMKFVKPQILFTLWYVTADESCAENLIKEFPYAPETSVVKGESVLMPTPFWYFVKRRGNALNLANEKQIKSLQKEIAKEVKAEEKQSANNSSTENENEKPKRQQVGLFGKKENAQNLVARLKDKGFSAYIEEEIRPSGNKYFLVIVDENEKNSMGMLLKTAGFDCYPVF